MLALASAEAKVRKGTRDLYRDLVQLDPTADSVLYSFGESCTCHFTGTRDLYRDLVQLAYNFARPHRALKFGTETRTPAMQAGLTTRRLTFREVFSIPSLALTLIRIAYRFADLTADRRESASQPAPRRQAA